MNKDFEKRTYNIIRKYFSKMLKYYVANKRISNCYFAECNKELLSLLEIAPKIKPPKYELLDNQKGLYTKLTRGFYNPCFVVGGGPSLKGFDFSVLKDKTTVVSNKSIFDVPNPNYFVSTDYTFLNYLKKENKYRNWLKINCLKFFIVNCISDVIQMVNGQITDTRYNLAYELQDFNRIIICKSAKSIGYDFENFNSGYNSGFSAFQTAVILGFNPIYLLGMDMTSDNETHYHQGYQKSKSQFEKNLSNYYPHFKNVLERLKIEKPELSIISCSKISLLNKVIPYKSIKEIL